MSSTRTTKVPGQRKMARGCGQVARGVADVGVG